MIRKLKINDYFRGYMDLINIFTKTKQNKTLPEFIENFDRIKSDIFVIEKDDKIIASISVLIDYKFHNNFKSVGCIGELVVDSKYQIHGYGSSLIAHAIEFCTKNNCYKIVLNCNDDTRPFYIKNGFCQKGIEMSMYLN
jgi:glucosamine-phosphate N-acetyltransferase